MSGIAGYFAIEGLAGQPGRELLQRMSRFQAHRGPDGEGYFQDDIAGLANRRLAVMQGEAHDQPAYSPDGRYVLTMNGAIYNAAALRAELTTLGHSFTSEADSEVVLAAFAQWGAEGFDHLNGMWGLAIYDRVDKRLTLSRDHLGIKPLYYAPLDGAAGEGTTAAPAGVPAAPSATPEGSAPVSAPPTATPPGAAAPATPPAAAGAPAPATPPALLFSSELKPTVFSGLIERRPNDRAIYRYLRFRLHDDNEETFFAGVFQLLGGQVLEADAQGIRVRSYTTLIDEMVASSQRRDHEPYSQQSAQRYRQMLTESVRARLKSDQPIGAAVSGGMDSTTLATIACELIQSDPDAAQSVGPKLTTFSAVFPGSINDEEQYVDAFLRLHPAQVNPVKCTPTPDDFIADFDDFIYTMEQPIISTGPYAQYKMLQTVGQHVHVFLTGAGPDEMMAGYVPYYYVYLRQLLRQRRFGRLLREGVASVDKIVRLLRVRFASRLGGKKAWDFKDFIAPEFAAAHASERYAAVQDNLKLRLVYDLTSVSAPCVARYEDRSAMRFSVEGRLPFVDKELVRYIWSLTDDALIHGSWNKRMLRDAMLADLPSEVANRRNKVGFSTPEVEWFGILKDMFKEIIDSESFGQRPYFNAAVAREAFTAYHEGRGDATTLSFWRLLHLELWLRAFIDAPLPPTPAEPPHPRGGTLRDMTRPAPPLAASH